MYQSRIGTYAAVAIFLGSAMTACGNNRAAEASRQASPPEVGVVLVRSQNVALSSELPGRTAPYQVAEVRPQVSGIIQKRLFTEGSDVKAGDVLYQIDPRPYEAAHSRAKAELARADANLTTLQLREKRYRVLLNSNLISQQEHDDVLAAFKEAQAGIEAARAALETARINLEYTRVQAPISGRIGRSSVTTGALVTANQPVALATIHQLDPMYVDVTQSTAELLELRRKLASGELKKIATDETEARLILGSNHVYPHRGTVKFSDVSVDQSTGSVVLRTIFPNPDQTLLPGMFVRAVIGEGIAEKAILVPQQGVSRNPRGEAVGLVVDPSGVVEQRSLTVDRAVGNQWLVSSGLSEGDRLIVEGSQKVRPGKEAKVVLFEGATAENAPGKPTQPQDSRHGGA